MKSNYDILGNHIRLIDTRNRESITDRVLGINIDKFFMPSVANVIGTDLSKYKLITKGKFACNPMHVGRDERLPVALYDEEEPAIVSPAYFMFEVIDNSILNEDYLMMWFRRPEFDRICWLHTDGSVRGGITWDDICRLELPIPPIENQLEIVNSYKAIVERIALKQKINDNLEAMALTIYKSFFVDFEPFDFSQPDDWKEVMVDDIAAEVICGKTPPTSDSANYGGSVPFITIPDMHGSVYTTTTERFLSDKGVATQANKTLPENSICVSCIASVGLVCLTAEPSQTNQQINSIICKNGISPFYVYIKMTTLTEYLKQLGAGGSTTLNVNKTLFGQIPILLPDETVMKEFHGKVEPLFSAIRANQYEMQRLESLKSLFLTQISSR
ncbi:restriction endonuclease subunit S [[Clostridium] innocuum]|nr:restriction endonuclease subunit S [[Clostridium] innocuum]